MRRIHITCLFLTIYLFPRAVVKTEPVFASAPAARVLSRQESSASAPAPARVPSRQESSASAPSPAPARAPSRQESSVPAPSPAPARAPSREDSAPAHIEDGGDTQDYLLRTAPRLSKMERDLMAHNEAPSRDEELSSTIDGGGRQLRAVRRAAPAEPVTKRAKKAQMVDKQSQTD